MSEVVTDDDVQKAIDFLRHNTVKSAKARAERLYLEQFRKSKKALLMQEAARGWNGPHEMPLAAQEREAYAHPEMLTLLEGYRVAVENDERCRFGMLAAQSVIDAWRTQKANERAMERLQ
jgi:hypothetical protein